MRIRELGAVGKLVGGVAGVGRTFRGQMHAIGILVFMGVVSFAPVAIAEDTCREWLEIDRSTQVAQVGQVALSNGFLYGVLVASLNLHEAFRAMANEEEDAGIAATWQAAGIAAKSVVNSLERISPSEIAAGVMRICEENADWGMSRAFGHLFNEKWIIEGVRLMRDERPRAATAE